LCAHVPLLIAEGHDDAERRVARLVHFSTTPDKTPRRAWRPGDQGPTLPITMMSHCSLTEPRSSRVPVTVQGTAVPVMVPSMVGPAGAWVVGGEVLGVLVALSISVVELGRSTMWRCLSAQHCAPSITTSVPGTTEW
jgi:hypothetical protein